MRDNEHSIIIHGKLISEVVLIYYLPSPGNSHSRATLRHSRHHHHSNNNLGPPSNSNPTIHNNSNNNNNRHIVDKYIRSHHRIATCQYP
jgi:hypothetical protein